MRILVVDDSKMILQMAVDVMKVNGIEADIQTETQGKNVVKRLHEEQFDLLILDIIMPEISGMDVLRQIQEEGMLDDIFVMMFTSLSDKRAMRECFRLGAFDYINKPIEPDEFIARIQNALKQQALRSELSSNVRRMRRQNEKLVELNNKLQDTQSQLMQQEQMAGIGHLAAGVAHEINNPLGYVISNVEILKSYLDTFVVHMEMASKLKMHVDPSSAEATDLLQQLESLEQENDMEFMKDDIQELFSDTNNGLERVSKIVEGLRVFSRIDQLDELEEYDVNAGVETTLTLTKSESKYIADIYTDLKPVPAVQAMGSQINQVILNVLMNSLQAVKDYHGDSRGEINVRTFEKEGMVFLEIEDNGIGMSEQVKLDIFKPFYTSRPIGAGTGLGLSIARDIVMNKHGGVIEVESEPNEGTVIRIGLPIEPDQGQQLNEKSE